MKSLVLAYHADWIPLDHPLTWVVMALLAGAAFRRWRRLRRDPVARAKSWDATYGDHRWRGRPLGVLGAVILVYGVVSTDGWLVTVGALFALGALLLELIIRRKRAEAWAEARRTGLDSRQPQSR